MELHSNCVFFCRENISAQRIKMLIQHNPLAQNKSSPDIVVWIWNIYNYSNCWNSYHSHCPGMETTFSIWIFANIANNTPPPAGKSMLSSAYQLEYMFCYRFPLSTANQFFISLVVLWMFSFLRQHHICCPHPPTTPNSCPSWVSGYLLVAAGCFPWWAKPNQNSVHNIFTPLSPSDLLWTPEEKNTHSYTLLHAFSTESD